MIEILALIIGPVSGIAIVLFQNHRSGRNNSEQVQVAAKEARTHEFEVLLEGYQSNLALISTDLKSTREELKEARLEVASQAKITKELAERVDQLQDDVIILEDDRQKLVQYVAIIEAMLPEPVNVPRPELSVRKPRN